MDIPIVSICIPTYNQVQYLSVLLDSIAVQKFRNFEVIISDDSNTDDVFNLVDGYKNNLSITYYRNVPAWGSPENWNAAIKKGKGELIKIMHHDDAFNGDNALGDLVNFFQSENLDFAFSNTKIKNAVTGKFRIHQIKNLQRIIAHPEVLFFGNKIGAPSTLILKKSITEKINYDKNLIWLVDIEYYYRLFLITANGSSINDELILTHDAAAHQISAKCLEDYDLQIREQLYLFKTMKTKVSPIQYFFMQMLLIKLFLLANVSNEKVKEFFRDEKIPYWIKMFHFNLRNSIFTGGYQSLVFTINKFRKLLIR